MNLKILQSKKENPMIVTMDLTKLNTEEEIFVCNVLDMYMNQREKISLEKAIYQICETAALTIEPDGCDLLRKLYLGEINSLEALETIFSYYRMHVPEYIDIGFPSVKDMIIHFRKLVIDQNVPVYENNTDDVQHFIKHFRDLTNRLKQTLTDNVDETKLKNISDKLNDHCEVIETWPENFRVLLFFDMLLDYWSYLYDKNYTYDTLVAACQLIKKYYVDSDRTLAATTTLVQFHYDRLFWRNR